MSRLKFWFSLLYVDYDERDGPLVSEEHSPESAIPLDERYDAVTEAKSILNSWLQKKTEINKEELLLSDEISSKASTVMTLILTTFRYCNNSDFEVIRAVHF